VHPSVRFAYDFDDKTRLEMVQHFTFRDQGVPGLGSNLSGDARLTRREWLGAVKVMHQADSGFFWKSQTYGRWSKSQFNDPSATIGLGGSQDNDDDTTMFGQRFELDYSKIPAHQFKSYMFYQTERFAPENFAVIPSQGGTSVRHQWNAGARYEGSFFDDRVTLSPGVWMENVFNRINNDDPSLLTPGTFTDSSTDHFFGAGLQVGYWPTSWLGLSGNVSRNARFPHFGELFGDQGGILGNPTLDPQKSVEWDAGVELKPRLKTRGLKNLVVKSSYFDRHVTDLIQFEQQAGFARARNVGSARIHGLEAQVEATLAEFVDVYGHYTWEFAREGATGRHIPGRPRHELHAGVDARFKKVNPFFNLDWLDANFLDPLGTRKVNNRWIVSGGVSVGPFYRTTLTFEGKNLGGSQIVDVVGFPLPGRSFFGKLSWDI
jgi:iron complex outermembrane receptor protein